MFERETKFRLCARESCVVQERKRWFHHFGMDKFGIDTNQFLRLVAKTHAMLKEAGIELV